MQATKKVTAIYSKSLNGTKNEAPKLKLWMRAARSAGIMNDTNEPKWNGTAIVCVGIAFLMAIIVVIQGGLNAFDKKDEARFATATAIKVAADTDKLLNTSEERRAGMLEFIKQKNRELYDQLPEQYKRFDSREFNKTILEENKEK